MKETHKSKIAALVSKARGDMSQAKFAELLGVTQGTVQAWESGKSAPTVEHLEGIAVSSGYRPEDVMAYLSGEPLPKPISEEFVLKQIKYMKPKQIAIVGRAITERLVAIAESAGGR